MQTFIEKLSLRSTLIILAIVAISAHAMLIPVGLGLMTSEWAIFSLVAEDFRHGLFSAFPMQQPYAGLTLSAIRGLFSFLWAIFDRTPTAHVHAHMVFSYALCPVFMTWCSYFLLKEYCSKTGSFLVGLVCAFGFQFWVSNYGNDFYPFYYMVGCILLAWRARVQNPIVELSLPQLLIAGVVAGHLYYTTPAAIIFAVAFFVPIEIAPNELRKLFSHLNRLEKFLISIAGLFLGLFFYVEFFGRHLGQFLEKNVKIDSGPNFTIALLIVGFVWLKRYWNEIVRTYLKKISAVLVGAFLGLLPWIIFWLSGPHSDKAQLKTESYDFQTSLQVVGMIPNSLRELFTADRSFGQNTSLVLFAVSLILLIQKLRRGEKKYWAVAFSGALSLILYCRVRTYVLPMAPARYLFPIFPTFVVMLGLLWDKVHLEFRSRVITVLLLGLFAAHIAHHVCYRTNLAADLRARQVVENMWKTVEAFQRINVSVVISDDFLSSNTYTFMSRRQPLFWSTGRRWGVALAEQLAHSEKRAGIFLTNPTLKAELLGRNWTLEPIGRSGDRYLYTGTTD